MKDICTASHYNFIPVNYLFTFTCFSTSMLLIMIFCIYVVFGWPDHYNRNFVIQRCIKRKNLKCVLLAIIFWLSAIIIYFEYLFLCYPSLKCAYNVILVLLFIPLKGWCNLLCQSDSHMLLFIFGIIYFHSWKQNPEYELSQLILVKIKIQKYNAYMFCLISITKWEIISFYLIIHCKVNQKCPKRSL